MVWFSLVYLQMGRSGEMADTLVLEASAFGVGVQVPPAADSILN